MLSQLYRANIFEMFVGKVLGYQTKHKKEQRG
jgi:hypothetical protein